MANTRNTNEGVSIHESDGAYEESTPACSDEWQSAGEEVRSEMLFQDEVL
jgi:hypothetical protein